MLVPLFLPQGNWSFGSGKNNGVVCAHVSLAYQGTMATRMWKIGVSAFNLLNHKNVAYYQYDLTTTPMTAREITGLSFTPTIFVQLDIN